MSISSFEQLVDAALRQPEPQRLLFVFTQLELPEDASPEQRARFSAGAGGALTPVACLDRAPEELGTFDELLEESRQFVPEWAIVFVAALSGRDGAVPTAEEIEAPLMQMVESIKTGSIGTLIPFDTRGETVFFGPT